MDTEVVNREDNVSMIFCKVLKKKSELFYEWGGGIAPLPLCIHLYVTIVLYYTWLIREFYHFKVFTQTHTHTCIRILQR